MFRLIRLWHLHCMRSVSEHAATEGFVAKMIRNPCWTHQERLDNPVKKSVEGKSTDLYQKISTVPSYCGWLEVMFIADALLSVPSTACGKFQQPLAFLFWPQPLWGFLPRRIISPAGIWWRSNNWQIEAMTWYLNEILSVLRSKATAQQNADGHHHHYHHHKQCHRHNHHHNRNNWLSSVCFFWDERIYIKRELL